MSYKLYPLLSMKKESKLGVDTPPPHNIGCGEESKQPQQKNLFSSSSSSFWSQHHCNQCIILVIIMVNIEEMKDNAMEALLGDELINSKPGSKPLSTAKTLADKDLVLLYFSAGTFV